MQPPLRNLKRFCSGTRWTRQSTSESSDRHECYRLCSACAGLSPASNGGAAEGGAAGPQPEAIPPLRAQLGLAAPAAGRAPQKYLIQNHSGLRVFYWADKVEAEPRTACKHPSKLERSIISDSNAEW